MHTSGIHFDLLGPFRPRHPKLKAGLILLGIAFIAILMTIACALFELSVLAGILFVIAFLVLAASIDSLHEFLKERAQENDTLPYDAHFLAGETDD